MESLQVHLIALGASCHQETHRQTAILIEGNDNKVQRNDITEAPIGVLKPSGTVGNMQSGNSFFDTLIPVQDPVPAHIVHVALQR
jgi:hypothetical protein